MFVVVVFLTIVNCILFIYTEPPSVTTLQPAPVVVDTTVDLVCVVTGDTPIDIVWEHVLANGSVEEVFTGNDTTGGNFTLTVNMNDYGMYRCNVSSRFGANSTQINIIQAGEYMNICSKLKCNYFSYIISLL